MVKNRNKKWFLFSLGFLFFIAIANEAVADIDQYTINYFIPGESIGPNITSWSNSKTQDSGQNVNLNIGENIKFNVTPDQIIDTWSWYKDGIIQYNNYDNFTTSWPAIGNKIISVNGTNINGTTNTIIWNINILDQAILTACGTLNKSNSVYVLNSSVYSNGTCFIIGANNVTLDGQGNNVNYATTMAGYGISDTGGYSNINVRNLTLIQQNSSVTNSHGIYLRNAINSRADTININTKNNAKGLYLNASSSNIFSNIKINTINNGAHGIYLESSNSNSFSNCNITTTGTNSNGAYTTLSNSNIFSMCNITTNNADGVYLRSSYYNSYSGSSISTSGTGKSGIWLDIDGNYNNFTNMDVLSSSSGIRLNSVSSNVIKDGSIISKSANDYYLQNSPTINNFINTNFTTRKIYFADGDSIFNYATNNIALNTNQIGSNKALTITRALINWGQTNISWQEKISATRTLNYGIGGLLPNTNYSVWNGPVISYNLTTDTNGNLPNFSINLATSAKTIKVENVSS